jgi:hypothetical protein
MKKFIAITFSVVMLFSPVGISSALTYSFEAVSSPPLLISEDGYSPKAWFKMGNDTNPFPSWYDPTDVSKFKITLTGLTQGSSAALDTYISFASDPAAAYTSDPSTALYISSYVVPLVPWQFTLTFDIAQNALLYNNVYVGSLANISLDNFIVAATSGYFWVGYGCHFDHVSTKVDLASVPEPTTLLLLGIGLIGVARLARKIM